MTNHIRGSFNIFQDSDFIINIHSDYEACIFLDLWLTVEAYFNNYFEISGFTGLCEMFDEMEKTGVIHDYEEEYLAGKIELEIVKNTTYYPFLWPIFEKEPRAQFIQEQILKAIRNYE